MAAATIRLVTGTAPATPPTGSLHIYAKTDKNLYIKNDAGTETQLGSGGGGGPADTDALPEGVVNLYFTDERAQDAVGTILGATTTITLTYDDAGNAITADVNDDSITDILISTTAGIQLSKLAGVTANRAIVSDASGFLTASSVTDTELNYLSGVNSGIQTQLDSKVPDTRSVSTTAPLTGGGALSSDLTLSMPAATAVASGYLTSTDWSTFNNKAAAGSYITALTGDVTGTGPGSTATTIAAGAVDNGKVAAGAAIAVNKLAAVTVSRALASDGSGFITPSATTSTELGYVSGVTSSIQTQIDSKQATGNYVTSLTGDVTASGPGAAAATIAAGAVTNSKIAASAGISVNKLAALTANKAVATDASGFLTPSTTTDTELGYVAGVTSSIQTQLNAKGAGTVTSVSVTTANGVSGSVATATTTPAITLSLGAITPSSVAAVGTVTGSNLSGTNTGDQTITLTGDVTGSGTGSFATTIANNAITNVKVDAAAAIALSKLAATTTNRALVSDGSGVISPATTTATEIGYVNGVTSAIQTQLNAKQATGNYITALTGDVTATGPGSVASTIAVGAVTDAKGSLAVKPSVTVVATTNQALTGTPTIDGQATAVGSVILLTAQSTGSQNGPWVAAAGAWARPSWYPSGGTTQSFAFITALVRLGTTYQGTTWRMTTTGGITIDTTATTWAIVPLAVNSSTITGTVPTANTGSNLIVSVAGISFDGGGSPITTGAKNFIEIPFSGTITGWTLVADQTGSMVVDVWKDTYANSPPTVADTITGASKPTISASTKGQNLSVSGWTTTVTAGDILRFNVDSCSSITYATLILRINRI